MVRYKNYVIDADPREFILREEKVIAREDSKKIGETYAEVLGYYQTIEGAVAALEKHMLRKQIASKEMDLKELKKAIKEIHKDIENELKA